MKFRSLAAGLIAPEKYFDMSYLRRAHQDLGLVPGR